MIAALVIVFREVLEAALIIGLVLAATRGLAGSRRWVGFGILGGLLGAAIVAMFAGMIADALAGYGQEVFNACVLLLAVTMLAWHNASMAVHGREMALEVHGVGDAVRVGRRPLYTLAVVVGLAVLREGAETVLFLYGLAASEGGFATAVSGGAMGLVIGVAVGATLYYGLLRVPTRHLFSVTTWMISLLAAGMAAQAMVFLNAADVVPLGEVLWDTSDLLSQDSLAGNILHTLIGYMDRPTPTQLVAYVGTLVLIVAAAMLAKRSARHSATKTGAAAAE